MPAEIFTQVTASVAELSRSPMATVAIGGGEAVGIMDGNHPAFYRVPAKAYEALMDQLDDAGLNVVADVLPRRTKHPGQLGGAIVASGQRAVS